MSDLLLQKFQNLVDLSEDDRRLLETWERRDQQFDAHRDLIRDGHDPRYVMLVLDGWACRYKQLEDGRRQIVAFFLPGDFCDRVVLHQERGSHVLGSLTPLSVARLRRDEISDFMMKSIALAKAFWLDMLASVEIQREWTVSLGRRTATERMAHLFCELPLRLKAVGLSNGTECEMPVTQTDLGDTLGLSAVHVNRTLQELRGMGLIEVRGRKLSVFDMRNLQSLAMFDPTYLHLSIRSL